MQLVDGAATGRGEGGAQHLDADRQFVVQRADVGHVAGDALLEEVLLRLGIAPHVVGAQRTFHPVLLDDVAGRGAHEVALAFGVAGEEVPHHHGVGPQGHGHGDFGRAGNAAVGDDGQVGVAILLPLVARCVDFH